MEGARNVNARLCFCRGGESLGRSAHNQLRPHSIAVNAINKLDALVPIVLGHCLCGTSPTAMETTKERWCEADIHRIAGEIALLSPEPDAAKAEAYFECALTVARQQQAKSWEHRAAMSMARLWRSQGKPQQARKLLASIYGWFTEGFDTHDLKEAKALLEQLAA
jgi:hypothetical protein